MCALLLIKVLILAELSKLILKKNKVNEKKLSIGMKICR